MNWFMTREWKQHSRTKTAFSKHGTRTPGHPYAKKKKKAKKNLCTEFIVFTQNNSKWIMHLNVKWKIIKLERNWKKPKWHCGWWRIFGFNTKAKICERTDKLESLKLKLLLFKRQSRGWKENTRARRKYLQKTHLKKDYNTK